MTLPGKLTICLLEEDVPQKAYFRIKPLYVKGEGAFESVENAQALLPDEGGIRIVPDKNESSRFKARMRTLGKFCVLDLTKHPNENDKIRPNKNYSPEKMENNRNIVYSDVIERCPEDILLEVVRVDEIKDGKAVCTPIVKPDTPLVALISGGKISGPYGMTEGENEGECIFTLMGDYEERTFDEAAYTRLFKIPLMNDAFAEIIVSSNASPIFRKKAEEIPEKVEPAPADEDAEEKCECKPETHAEEIKIKEPAADAEIETEKTTAEAPKEEAPAPAVSAVSAPTAAPVPAGEPIRPAPAPVQPAPVQSAPVKIQEEEIKKPVQRLSAREQALNSQTGLNPRRGRSLSEVVDDGWRKSRIEQLGAPIPGDVMGTPVISPIELAAETLKKAWALKEARGAIADEILAIEDMADVLAPRFANGASSPATSAQIEQMNDLEAERLKLLREIDDLVRRRLEKRTELMDEARQVHKDEIKKMEDAISRLKAECEKRLKAAEDARDAQVRATRLMDDTMRDTMKQGLIEYAIHAGAVGNARIATGVDETDYMRSPKTYEPTGAQLVSDIRKIFEQGGLELSNDEAVNLIACIAIGKIAIISGETGSGKSTLVRNLASALGLNSPGARRFACLAPGQKSALEDAKFKALTRYEDMNTLRILMLDDANQLPDADQARGLTTWAEDPDRETSLRVVMTVMDDQIGYPLNTRLIDRAFMIRLSPAAPTAWTASKPTLKNADKTVSLAAIEKIFAPADHTLPGEIVNRMQVLIEKLEKMNISISGRALSDMYAYCAACIPLMTCPPKAVLDYALSQRAIPHILATARIEVLEKLPELLSDMPRCLNLMNLPLPFPPV